MLQQTRVSYVEPYYERFLRAFPTLEKLAEANLDDVLRIWEGLGYYARARNLHAAAREVVASGMLPSTCENLRSLPGIGPYSSRAIASIAFGEPVAAVDGNVRRVVSRIFAHPGDPPKAIQELVNSLLCPTRPGDFNQAMMELGARSVLPGVLCATAVLSKVIVFLGLVIPRNYIQPLKRKHPSLILM